MSNTIYGQNVPTQFGFSTETDLQDFKNELKSKSVDDLSAMLKGGRNAGEVMAIIEELALRQAFDLENLGTPKGSGDAKRIRQLLLALMNGTISESGKDELAKLLGIDISALDTGPEMGGNKPGKNEFIR